MPRPKLTFILSAQARRDAADTPGLHQLMEAIVNRDDVLLKIKAEAELEAGRQRNGYEPNPGMPHLRQIIRGGAK